MAEYCLLISRSVYNSTVELKHKEPAILGRGTLTSISDELCCVKHVEVTANFSSKELVIKQLCSHSSVAGATELQQDEFCILGPGAKLDLLGGTVKYTYHVFFGKGSINNELLTWTTHPPHNYLLDVYDINWESSASLLIMDYGPQHVSPYVAAFDLDGTLIKTNPGHDTWMHWHPCVPHKIKTTSLCGYRIVIFTNQGGISHSKPTVHQFQAKVDAVVKTFETCPVTLLASINDDEYRKPRTKMWKYFLEQKNNCIIDKAESFYIGDAAGRKAEWKKGKKKDFSCCDRKFAANISLSFHTPEEFFLGELPCPNFTWDGFNPFSSVENELPILEPQTSCIVSESPEIVVYTGCPASGKTHFYKEYMRQYYYHVNRDKLGSWQNCVTQCEHSLQTGNSVVIDNTNPDIESRARYINIAQKYKVPIRCMWFTTSIPHAMHNNRFREYTTKDPGYKHVPRIAFSSYQSKFTEPSLNEGFNEIIKIKFSLKFTDTKLKDIYMQFFD